MGFATMDQVGYKTPAWVVKNPKLAHCSHCDAIYSKDQHYVKCYNHNGGTLPPDWIKIRDCKPNACPVCER